MKKIISTLILTFLGVIAMNSAKAQVKIAVLDFKAGVAVGQTDVDGISAIFGTYFINPQKFTLVERTQIDRVVREQGFQYSSLTNQQMVRVGQILNISRMIVGDVNIVSGQYNVDVRIVNAETGAVEATDGATWANGTSYRELMKGLATRLMTKMNYQVSVPVQSQPRVSKPTTVVTLLGYLHVSPDDLGEFSSEPTNIIASINNQKLYGYDDWRLPVQEELELMNANRSELGLKSGSYMTSNGRAGNVRLVTTGKTVVEKEELRKEEQRKEEQRKEELRKEELRKEELRKEEQRKKDMIFGANINGVFWALCNVGAKGTFVSSPEKFGNYYNWSDAKTVCPLGWRLPTRADFLKLLSNNVIDAGATINGVAGRLFADPVTGSEVFFPGAGMIDASGGYNESARGCWYPSSSVYRWGKKKNDDTLYTLNTYRSNPRGASLYEVHEACRFSVRCVRQ